MTNLNPFKRDSSPNPAPSESYTQDAKRFKTTPRRAIPNLTEACLNQIWCDLEKSPLTNRIAYIGNSAINPALRLFFLQKVIQSEKMSRLKEMHNEIESMLTLLLQDINAKISDESPNVIG